MEQPVVRAVAIIAGAVLIPLALWRVVGERRHRDPLLLPLGIIATAFLIAGVGEMIEGGGTWKLIVGGLGLSGFALRWRSLTPERPADAALGQGSRDCPCALRSSVAGCVSS